jgi:hypothetical protein
MSRGDGASFHVVPTGLLAEAGLGVGRLGVSIDGDSLLIEGEQGRGFSIPAGDVAQLRIGRVTIKNGIIHEARIWCRGEKRPFHLVGGGIDPGYARVMRAFAARVEAAGGELWRGDSMVNAVILLILSSASIAALALCLALYAWLTPSWAFAVAALAVAAGNIWFTRRLLARIWPRRVRAVADLDNALPSIDGRAP